MEGASSSDGATQSEVTEKKPDKSLIVNEPGEDKER